MKTLRMKLMTLAAGALMFSFAAQAQHHGHDGHHGRKDFDPETMAQKQTERMKTELSLDDQQAGKVESINLKYALKKKKMREEIKKQMKALEQEKHKELEGVLTKEQMEKYRKSREEHGQHKREEFRNKKE